MVVGLLLIGLLEASLQKSAGVIWMAPFRVVAYSHGLLIDLVLRSLSIHWGSFALWLLITYMAVGVPAAVASEKIAPPASSSARWRRALIVWLVALGGLTLVTLTLGWLGILTV